MKAAFLALSLLGQSPVPISDHVPIIDVEALCTDVLAGDKASGLPQDASKCVSDEKAAQQQLNSIWLTVPAEPRESCEALAMAGRTKLCRSSHLPANGRLGRSGLAKYGSAQRREQKSEQEKLKRTSAEKAPTIR